MAEHELEDDEREFTPTERKEIREHMQRVERRKWLWSSLRVWAGYVSGAIVGAWAVAQVVAAALKVKIGTN